MNPLSVLRGLTASLSALLRATAPSGRVLTGVEGLEHTRKVALLALADGMAFNRDRTHASPPLDALATAMMAVDDLLKASEHCAENGYRPTVDLVHARCAGWDALDVALAEVKRLQVETPDPMAGLDAADRDLHRAFRAHELSVAMAFERAFAADPTTNARDFADARPFVPTAC